MMPERENDISTFAPIGLPAARIIRNVLDKLCELPTGLPPGRARRLQRKAALRKKRIIALAPALIDAPGAWGEMLDRLEAMGAAAASSETLPVFVQDHQDGGEHAD